MSRRGKLAPLRSAFQYEAASRQFELDPVLGLVEPPQAATLELQKLRGFGKVCGAGHSGLCRVGRTGWVGVGWG